MVLNAYYILLWIRISKQIIAYLYFFVNEGTRRKTYRAGTQYKMYFIDNVIFSLQFFVEYGRINIHRLSRWFFIFGQLALILPAARKPRL